MSRNVAYDRFRDGSLENASCARGTDRAKLNQWRGKSRHFRRFSSFSRVHYLAQRQIKLIRARCGAQNGSSQRAKRCFVWPKWNVGILFQNSARRTHFFHLKAIKTGHILMICRQTCHILSVSSKGNAAAKWRENFKITLQILQVQTPNVHSKSVASYLTLNIQYIASSMMRQLS